MVLLLNETTSTSESSGSAHMLIVQVTDLPFVPVPRFTSLNSWKLPELKVYPCIDELI